MMNASIGSTIGSGDTVRTSLLTEHAEAQGSAQAEHFFRSRLQAIDEPCAPFGFGEAFAVPVEARRVLDGELARRLVLQAEHSSFPCASIVHAAWALVIWRITFRDAIVYGVATSEGQRDASELPLGLRMSDQTAEGLVTQVHIDLQMLELHASTSSAFARRCSSVPEDAPLFTTTLRYTNVIARPSPRFAENQESERTSALHTVRLLVAHEADALVVEAHALQPTDPARIVGYFETALRSLLCALAHEPRTDVRNLTILPERERAQVIEDFNDTRVAFEGDLLIHQLVEAQAAQTPDATAVIHGTRALTYAELDARANEFARRLIREGIGPDQLVGLYLERSLEMVIGMLAVLKAGGAYVPLDPNYPAERLQYMVDDAAPRVILTQAELRARLARTSAKVIALDVELQQLDVAVAAGAVPFVHGLRADHLIYVIYTSGSTGRPKGIAMPHRAVANLLAWQRCEFGVASGVRVLQFAALSFDVAFQEVFSTLSSGGTLVLLDEWVRRDPCALLDLLRHERIERLFVPPLVLQGLAEHCRVSGALPGDLKDVIVAGEQLRISAEIRELLSRTVARLHNQYGPTETHVVTALTLAPPVQDWPALPTIGRPIANTQIYILDPWCQPVPLGAVGEIYIGGANVARGYLNRPELTSARFHPDPFGAGPSATMYRTGDVGRWRSDGTIEYLGRNDDQVKIRGFRVELGEIETALARHERVREVAVVARELGSSGKRLIAYVTARSTPKPDAQSLRSFLRSSLPEHMMPSAFVVLDLLPVTPSGKLDRRALPTPAFAVEDTLHAMPQGEVEEALAAIWQEVLGVHAVGRQAHFFELGGDSLSAMRVLVKLTERFRVPLAAHSLFLDPTLRAIAQSVEAQLSVSRSGTLPKSGLRGEPGIPGAPLTAMQRQWWTYVREQQHGLTERLCYIATKIFGPLDSDCLRRAIDHAVTRHAALRTRIVLVDGAPEQHIDSAAKYEFESADLGHMAAGKATSELSRQAEEFVTRKILLAGGPLFAAKLFRLSAREHVLVLALEHIITDGSSMTVLHQDLWSFYAQAADDQPLALPELPLQFADYALWQQQTHDSWTIEHEPYWRAHLGGAPAVRLPLAENPAPKPVPEYAAAKIAFGAELSEGLRAVARRERTLLPVTVLAIYVAAMSKWCAQRDLTVVFVSNARLQPELQRVVGFLTNHLHLRVRLGDDDTLGTLMQRLAAELSAAYEHNDFDRVPLLFPECATELYFNWESASWMPASVELWPHSPRALRVEPLPLDVPWPRRFVPLFHETESGIVVTVHYRSDLVPPESVARFGSCLVCVAEQVVRNPEIRMSDLTVG